MTELTKLLENAGLVSGYGTSLGKFEILGLEIAKPSKENVKQMWQAKWKSRNIR